MKKKRPIEALVLLSMFCHIFAMAVVCLTDGQEGNRMSLSTFPAVIIMAGYTISEAAGRIGSRWNQPTEETAKESQAEKPKEAASS